MHRMRTKIMQRNDAQNRRCKRRRNLRVAHICDVIRSVNFEIVNLSVEGRAHLRRRSREINEHSTRVDNVDREAVCFEPMCNRFQILLRQPESLAKLLCREPLVEVWRSRIVKLINELLKFFL